MDKSTADILFEYLKDIIYKPEKAALDLTEIPEDFQKLGQGMQFLEKSVRELKTLGMALAKGNTSTPPPSVENVLAAPLKALQGALRHVTWQTQRVAEGDYMQRVDFMGDFAEAFNTMIKQLDERQSALENERDVVLSKNKALEQTRKIFVAVTDNAEEFMLVMDGESNKELFANKSMIAFEKNHIQEAEKLKVVLNEYNPPEETQEDEVDGGFHWEISMDANGRVDTDEISQENIVYYEVTTHPMSWEGNRAYAHVITDVTEAKQNEKAMEELAYKDVLTGLYNRRYGMKMMNKWAEEKRQFSIAFIDIDYLKYCNDVFGHEEGDKYITLVAEYLKELQREKLVCRIGGDEFMIVIPNISEKEMEELLYEKRSTLSQLKFEEDKEYTKSFSFGIGSFSPEKEKDISEILSEADYNMYQFKFAYKKKMKEEKPDKKRDERG